jgi:hypothetical protein
MRRAGFLRNDQAQMERRTPVFIVCSPLPRVGKTLVARLLIEYLAADRRRVAAFDLNPDGYALASELPEHTTIANIGGTKGQMALFDQLIVSDETAKVVDVGYTSFKEFFAVMEAIGFPAEARRRSVASVILFIAEPDHRSVRAYAGLQERFPEVALVPVVNTRTEGEARARYRHLSDYAGLPLHIPLLPPALKAEVERVGFSAAFYDHQGSYLAGEFESWARQVVLQFRELELRLLLEEIKPALRMRA